MTFGAKLSLQGRFCARTQTGFCSTSSSPLPSHLPPSTYHLLPSTVHHPPSTFHLPPSTFHLPPSTFRLPAFTFHFHLSLPPFTSGLLPLLLLPVPTLISHFLPLSHISCHQSPISHLSSSIFFYLLPFPLFPFFPSPFSSSLFLLFLSLFHCSTRPFPHFITVLSDPRPACPFPGAEGLSKARRPSAPRQQLNGLRGQTSAEGLEQKNRPSALGTP